jgi:hypothetical protein
MSDKRQENFSRTCWITFHWRGMSSNVSVTSSPSLCRTPPQHGQADGAGARPAASAPACDARRPALRPSRRRQRRPPSAPWLPPPRDPPPCRPAATLQLELIEQCAALQGLSKPLVAQLGDRELHLLDQQRTMARLGLGIARLSLCLQICRIGGNQHRHEGLDVVGQRIRLERHARMESQDAAGEPSIAH